MSRRRVSSKMHKKKQGERRDPDSLQVVVAAVSPSGKTEGRQRGETGQSGEVEVSEWRQSEAAPNPEGWREWRWR